MVNQDVLPGANTMISQDVLHDFRLISTQSVLPSVRTATADDVDQVIHSLVLAFSQDPAIRWMYPNPQQYLKYFPEFVKAFGEKAFTHHTAYYVGDYAGATLWFPPGVHADDESLSTILQQSVFESEQAEVFAVLEQMSTYHPNEPHWYLPLIGVDRIQQRKGYGSALLQEVLFLCDRDHQPAYLEASNPTNVPFYEKHGFEVLGKIQSEASPPIFPMLRSPL